MAIQSLHVEKSKTPPARTEIYSDFPCRALDRLSEVELLLRSMRGIANSQSIDTATEDWFAMQLLCRRSIRELHKAARSLTAAGVNHG